MEPYEASAGGIVLAGDVGGSKTDLALYRCSPSTGNAQLDLIREARLPSGDADDFESLVARFVGADRGTIDAACLGVAGPIRDDVARGVNLPWIVDARSVAERVGARDVVLRNDLQTTAFGTLFLPPSRVHTLHEGAPRPGNRAVIAAGTGLGQSFLFHHEGRYLPAATEGGHVDFAPRDDFEAGLLAFLRGKFGRVSYERVLSGPGLYHVFEYLSTVLGEPVAPAVAHRLESGEDRNAVVGEAGMTGACPTCERAVDVFVSLYGAQAGNLALTVFAIGGVWVAGGIVTKMLAKMTSGRFLEAFRNKGRYVDFMDDIPVHIVLEPRTSLLGAAHYARERLVQRRGD